MRTDTAEQTAGLKFHGNQTRPGHMLKLLAWIHQYDGNVGMEMDKRIGCVGGGTKRFAMKKPARMEQEDMTYGQVIDGGGESVSRRMRKGNS